MSRRLREPGNKAHSYDFDAPEAVWTVAEAKSRLSEVLRRASEVGPQQIGKQRPHVVVPLDQWLAPRGARTRFRGVAGGERSSRL